MHSFALADKLSVGYFEKTILQNLDFEIPKNSNTVILGPGGSGKTTLVRLLAQKKSKTPVWSKGNLKVFENKGLWMPQACVTGKDRLSFLFNSNPSNQREQLEAINHFCQDIPLLGGQILDNLNSPLSELPKEIVRAAHIAALFFQKSSLIAFDEPEIGLHPVFQAWMVKKFQQIRGTRNVLVVTHNLKFAREISDYVIFLVDGHIVEQGPANDFFFRPKKKRTKNFLELGS